MRKNLAIRKHGHAQLASPPNAPVGLPRSAIEMPRMTHDRRLGQRTVAEECPVAPVYDGTTVAVMATPADFSDVAVGFSLTEGIVRDVTEIEGLDIQPGLDGIELRIWLTPDCGREFKTRRRLLTGPSGGSIEPTACP
jgi:FdhD protein